MARDTYYDYIRALAALLVLFGHKGKMPGGAIGVSIFFCLSGFLVTKILIDLPALTFTNVAKFIFRRGMRIFPLYVATIAVTYFLMQIYKPELLPTYAAGIPGMVTFTHIPSWTGFSAAVGWTLHAEFWFYVLFPVIFYFTFKRGLLPYGIAILIAVSILAKIFAGDDRFTNWPIQNDMWLTVIYLDQLMFGAICAVLIASHSSFIDTFRSRWWFWAALVINLAIGKLLPFKGYNAFWYLESSGAALLCAVAILHHAANPKILSDNFIAWIGRISFSIYLIHAIARDYLPDDLIPKLDTPIFVVVVLVICYLTYHFIERPGIALSKTIAVFRPSGGPLKAAIPLASTIK